MNFNYIVFAIPVFFVLIGLELLVNKIRQGKAYRFNDAIANLNIGIGEQIFSVFLKAVLVMVYDYIYRHWALLEIPNTFLNGVILLFAFDFIYYWAHRMGHEINFFWGGHIVHHSSEEYNLTVALRQPWFYSFMSFFLFLPLAWIGFSVKLLVIVAGLDVLYQFWIHTKYIGKLGPLEWIFNTPSHHRVHHGVNPQYIDKNHGGVLIIWDRLFGTFEEEKEEVVYGITTPLKSWNPAWANVHYFVDLVNISKQFPKWTDKIKLWFMPPGWKPKELGGREKPKPVTYKTFKRFDFLYPKKLNSYVLAQFIVLAILVTGYLSLEPKFIKWQSAVFALYLIFTLSIIGVMFEKKRWAFSLEYIRLIAMPLVIILIPLSVGWLTVFLVIAFLLMAASLLWLMQIRKLV